MKEFFIGIVPTLIPLCVLVLILTSFDFITGISKAKRNDTFSSSKLKSGMYKFIAFFGVILVGISIDFIFYFYLKECITDTTKLFELVLKINSIYPITLIIKLYIIITECISIVENCKELGFSVPTWFVKILKTLQDKFELTEIEEDVVE